MQPVCDLAELPVGGRVIASLGEGGAVSVGVFNVNGEIVAFRNECPHAGAPVCVGTLGDAVVSTGDTVAVTALLENKTARIAETTYSRIADRASTQPLWHLPLINRDNLSIKTIKRIASFVGASLVEALIERNNLSAELVEEVRHSVRQRIERGDVTDGPPEIEAADERAQKLFKSGNLDETALSDALEAGDNAFVRHSLVLLSGLEKKIVDKMLNTKNAKGVVTLAWKAGMSMKLALVLQRKIAHIRPQFIIRPRPDGSFPMSEADLNWSLEFFTD